MSTKKTISTGNFLLTTSCPVECNHCLWSCEKHGEWMPRKTIKNVIKDFFENNIQNIHITGGEPFYNIKKLWEAIEIIKKYYQDNQIGIITSGFWANNKEITEKILQSFSSIGMLEVSTDRFHLKRVPLSNIANILDVSNQMNIKTLLRICLDAKSESLIKPLVKIINEYTPSVFAFGLDFKGRALKLNKDLNMNFPKLKHTLLSGIPINGQSDSSHKKFLNSSMKLSPTVFPNGDTYACCDCLKLTYMGNIQKEKLSSMLNKWNNNPASLFLLKNSYNCPRLFQLISTKCDHFCDFCKDNPLIESGNFGKDFIGRVYAKLSVDKLNVSLNKFNSSKEYLISIRIRQNDLRNKKVGKNVLKFLNVLKNKNVLFQLSRPLPYCLLNPANYEKLVSYSNAPKNCFECREMFSVENKNTKIKFCGVVDKIGESLDHYKDRYQIYEHFKNEYEKLKISKECKSCLFRIRNQCNGMCLRIHTN